MAGKGDDGRAAAIAALGDQASSVEFLGPISDEEKAALLSSVDVYCAPQTGGESFGIVLVEAMSAGAAVVASDLGAFRRVLEEGDAGVLFRTGDGADLARTMVATLRDAPLRERVQAAASVAVRRYDWSVVTDEVLTVYEMALATSHATVRVAEDPREQRRATRALRREGGAR